MIDSKSKGSIMNVQHMMCCVGQKTVEGTRIKKKVENRSLPIFHRDDASQNSNNLYLIKEVDFALQLSVFGQNDFTVF